MMETIGIVANITGLLALFVSLFIFFKDPLRRWSFLGFKPTAMLIIYDPKIKKVILVKNKNQESWYFPQGGIYDNNLNTVVDEVLTRELSVPKLLYKFVRTIPLGVSVIKGRKVERKFYPGSISLFPESRGKGFIACILYTDLNKFKRTVKLGIEIDKIKMLTIEEALRMISPDKARMIAKIISQI